MARDFYKVEPDKAYILNKHYNPGRAGAKVEFITRHHLMYIGEVEAVVDKIWSTRKASAHIVIGPKGRWGQAVWDRDTAWANADAWANQRTIAIEHSNNTGQVNGNDYAAGSWNISDETLITGARVAAAYCLYYGLGRPVYGKNIRDHNEFTSTGCPVHLQGPRSGNAWGGKAGKYHQRWMDEAQSFYDKLVRKEVNPDGTPKEGATNKKEEVNNPVLRRVHHELTHKFHSRYPGSKYKDTMIGFVLEMDRKIEDLHANMVPSVWKKLKSIDEKLDTLVKEGK